MELDKTKMLYQKEIQYRQKYKQAQQELGQAQEIIEEVYEKNKQLKKTFKRNLKKEREDILRKVNKEKESLLSQSTTQIQNLQVEKEYLENELQRLTEALMSMEQEFIAKEEEKTTLFADYEQEILSLNSDIAFFKSKQSIANEIPRIDQSSVLKEENELLHQEIKSYKNIKTNLEQQISKLKLERHQQQDIVNSKVIQLKEEKQECLAKLNKQQKNINNFNAIRKEFEVIIDKREEMKDSIQKKMEDLQIEILQKNEQILKMEDENIHLISQVSSLQNNLNIAQVEFNKMKDEQMGKLELYQDQLEKYEHELKSQDQYQQQFHDQVQSNQKNQQEIHILKTELEKYFNVNGSLQLQISNLKDIEYNNQELLNEINDLRTSKNKISIHVQSKDQQIYGQQNQIHQLENSLELVNLDIQKIMDQKNEKNNQTLKELKKEYTDKIEELQNKIIQKDSIIIEIENNLEKSKIEMQSLQETNDEHKERSQQFINQQIQEMEELENINDLLKQEVTQTTSQLEQELLDQEIRHEQIIKKLQQQQVQQMDYFGETKTKQLSDNQEKMHQEQQRQTNENQILNSKINELDEIKTQQENEIISLSCQLNVITNAKTNLENMVEEQSKEQDVVINEFQGKIQNLHAQLITFKESYEAIENQMLEQKKMHQEQSNAFQEDIISLSYQIKQIANDKSVLEDQVEAKEKLLEEQKLHYESKYQELSETYEGQVSELQDQLEKVSSVKSTTQGNNNNLEEVLILSQQQITNLNTQNLQLQDKLEKLRNKNSQSDEINEEEIIHLKQSIYELQIENQKLEQDFKVEELSPQIQVLKEENEKLKMEIIEKEKGLQENENKILEQIKIIEDITTEKDNALEQNLQIQNTVNDLQTVIEDLKGKQQDKDNKEFSTNETQTTIVLLILIFIVIPFRHLKCLINKQNRRNQSKNHFLFKNGRKALSFCHLKTNVLQLYTMI